MFFGLQLDRGSKSYLPVEMESPERFVWADPITYPTSDVSNGVCGAHPFGSEPVSADIT